MPDFPEVRVVGMHFRGSEAKSIAAALEHGESVRLEREPDNEYDAFAIKVFYEDTWIGYIERGQAAWIAGLLDEGAAPSAVVTGHVEANRNIHPLLHITID